VGFDFFFRSTILSIFLIVIPAVHFNPRDCFVPRNDLGFPFPPACRQAGQGYNKIHFLSLKVFFILLYKSIFVLLKTKNGIKINTANLLF
jgi:hypothetical protein